MHDWIRTCGCLLGKYDPGITSSEGDDVGASDILPASESDGSTMLITILSSAAGFASNRPNEEDLYSELVESVTELDPEA